jgi:two-component system chemotaxis sensor kinase CheA
MLARMQPVGNLWAKVPRVVRDLALACGKQVVVEMEGGATELDKSVIEAIRDPLTHLVRNAVDHGIEAAAARLAAGKPAEGQLRLRAWHEGGQVTLEIADDGAGIDVERVKRRAVEHGLVAGDDAERMTDREAVDLVFLPGFSTAEQVTNVSGRGVGMDVVRTNVERIGGAVEVRSQPGAGTTFRVEIPLTLAIIPALIVACADQRYALPQANLVELVRVGDAAGAETVHGAPVHRLRGRLLPLVRLREQLGLAEPVGPAGAAAIAVVQAGDRRFGLVVDHVEDTEEIVVKPLARSLRGIGVYAGATTMGDGTVSLILDVPGLAQRAGAAPGPGERAAAGHGSAGAPGPTGAPDPPAGPRGAEPAGGGAAGQALLVFQTGDDGRMAIPLALVDRLEELPSAAVELAGQDEVVQYRDGILPLVRISAALPERRRQPRRGSGPTPDGVIHVVVSTVGGRQVGLVVDRILDVAEEGVWTPAAGSRAGSAGRVVLAGRVTELLDLQALVAADRTRGRGRRPAPGEPQGPSSEATAPTLTDSRP